MLAELHRAAEPITQPTYDDSPRSLLATMAPRDNTGKQPEPKVKDASSRAANDKNTGSVTMDRNVQRLLKTYRIEAAASASSMVSTVCAFPLDSVKTRMQAHKYHGFVDCVQATYRKEGVKGFFRGSSSPSLTLPLLPTSPTYYPAYTLTLSSSRRYRSHGQRCPRTNRVFLYLPAVEEGLLRLAEEEVWNRRHGARELQGIIPKFLVRRYFWRGWSDGWLLHYLDCL